MPAAGQSITVAVRVRPLSQKEVGRGAFSCLDVQSDGHQILCQDPDDKQVESLGGTFLQVDYAEDGAGAGGYAKEMSDGFPRGDTNPRRRCEP